MPKDDLVISAPRQGIAQSPHVGFGNVVNLDISSLPGIVRLNNILVKKSEGTIVDQINWIVRNPATTTEVYALGNTGEVYKFAVTTVGVFSSVAVLAGHSNTNAHGNGMAIWKNYLFVARDTCLDVCGDGTSTGIIAANWSLDWTTAALTSDVLYHPMLVSNNDGNLYIGAGKHIISIREADGKTFAPGDNSTYVLKDTADPALDLPSDYRIKCLAEQGNNLMIGTWRGTNVYDIRVADIFPWDRSSVSFGQPIVMDECGVHALFNKGNSLIILAGTNGTIYKSDGVNAWPIGQLPVDLSGGKYLEWYPGAICSFKNKIFFGVGNGGTTAIDKMGVYSLEETARGNILNFEHIMSTENTGTTSAKITALYPTARDILMACWRSGDT